MPDAPHRGRNSLARVTLRQLRSQHRMKLHQATAHHGVGADLGKSVAELDSTIRDVGSSSDKSQRRTTVFTVVASVLGSLVVAGAGAAVAIRTTDRQLADQEKQSFVNFRRAQSQTAYVQLLQAHSTLVRTQRKAKRALVKEFRGPALREVFVKLTEADTAFTDAAQVVDVVGFSDVQDVLADEECASVRINTTQSLRALSRSSIGSVKSEAKDIETQIKLVEACGDEYGAAIEDEVTTQNLDDS